MQSCWAGMAQAEYWSRSKRSRKKCVSGRACEHRAPLSGTTSQGSCRVTSISVFSSEGIREKSEQNECFPLPLHSNTNVSQYNVNNTASSYLNYAIDFLSWPIFVQIYAC